MAARKNAFEYRLVGAAASRSKPRIFRRRRLLSRQGNKQLMLSFVIDRCLQPDPSAKPNLNPIQTAPPLFVKSVKNGKLYTVGEGDDMINVVHIWGKTSRSS